MKGYIEIHVVKNVRLFKNFAIHYVIKYVISSLVKHMSPLDFGA